MEILPLLFQITVDKNKPRVSCHVDDVVVHDEKEDRNTGNLSKKSTGPFTSGQFWSTSPSLPMQFLQSTANSG